MSLKAIDTNELKKRVKEIDTLLRKETNPKEKARLTDEQGSIKLVLRMFPTIRVVNYETKSEWVNGPTLQDSSN